MGAVKGTVGMAKAVNKLTARKVQSLKESGYYSDGNNLVLQITKAGSKSWLFIYKWQYRKVELGLGGVSQISLESARQKAAEYRTMLANGINPQDVKRNKATIKPIKTFKQCADEYIESTRVSWSNAKHVQQWANTINQYCVPILDLPVTEVDTDLVLKTLSPIWSTKNETANRLRNRIERILDYAKVTGERTGENPARWRGHLDKVLPKPSDIQINNNHEAWPFKDMSAFMEELQNHDCMAAKCLEFTILTASRTGESIGAKWAEIDGNVWKIPPERMKAGRAHTVPLPPRCAELLATLPRLNDYVFANGDKGLSNMAMLTLIKRMGHKGITVHGFRSSFRDWAAETMDYSSDVVEMCLAHLIKNQTEAAYRRGDLLEKRRKVMNDWANYCYQAAPSALIAELV